MAHAIDVDRIKAIHAAWRRASSTNIGLGHEAVEAGKWVNHCAGTLAGAEMRLTFFPHSVTPSGTTEVQHQRDMEDVRQRRFDQEDALRRELRSTGQASVFRDHIAAIGRPHKAEFQAAVAEAKVALQRAEQEVARIEQERAVAGRRAGALRQTVTMIADWCRQNGHGGLAREISA